MTLFGTLLLLHIAAGITALLAAVTAALSKMLDASHRVHVLAGRVFFWCMVLVCATAVPMTILHPSIFLALIAVFSFYLAFTGRRYAVNRRGHPSLADRIVSGGMTAASAGMIAYGGLLLARGAGSGIPLIVFGGIGGWLSLLDLKRMRAGGLKGAQRVAAHLTSMLAASIAALTAFAVTNISLRPGFLVWLAPTILITPLIVLWNRKVLAGRSGRVTG